MRGEEPRQPGQVPRQGRPGGRIQVERQPMAKAPTITRDITITNKLGMHARPASLVVQTSCRFRSDVQVIKGKQVIDGKSILGLLMLAAGQGTILTLSACGDDATEAINALEQLFNGKFGEE